MPVINNEYRLASWLRQALVIVTVQVLFEYSHGAAAPLLGRYEQDRAIQ